MGLSEWGASDAEFGILVNELDFDWMNEQDFDWMNE